MARGRQPEQRSMLALVDLESRIPADHPLRTIKQVADRCLVQLGPTFDAMYAVDGRPSLPPERLLKAGLLIALYSVRSERAFCEELNYHLLFRWFLDMDLVEPSFDASTFSKNRSRLLEHEVAKAFFAAVVAEADARQLLSDAHFSVDGTVIEAAASLKSLRANAGGTRPEPDDPGNPSVDYRGERRSNATHTSTTDPEARLYRKGDAQTSRLSFLGHGLMENRSGLLVDVLVTQADGYAERASALTLLDRAVAAGRHPATLGADKAYDTADFLAQVHGRAISPHIAPNNWATKTRVHVSTMDPAILASSGYAVSQRKRKRIEEIFGWLKTVGGLRRTRYRGVRRTQMAAYLVGAAYNLVRISGLERRMAS